MPIKNSKELFTQLAPNDKFHLIDLDQKLPLFYGIDKKGRYCLAYESEKSASDLIGTKILEIVSAKTKSGHYMTFLALSDNDFRSVFFSLCDDIISVLNSISDNYSGFLIFVDRIKKWKKMFASKSGLLSESVIQGLYGELYFLDDYMFQKYGMEKAIKSWGGPQGMAKDFSVDLDWFEVKCIGYGKDRVTISSAQQLASENPGYLVAVKTETVPEGFDNGIATVNELFYKICKELNKLPGSLDLFLDSIHKRGFNPEEEYDKYRFNVTGMDFYLVDKDFPKVILPPSYQSSIGKITYELILNSLKKYLAGGNNDGRD